MNDQLQSLKTMLAATPAWQSEVASLNAVGTDTALNRIHLYAAFESVHPYPRIEFANAGWDYDFSNGNCKTKIRLSGTIDLIRPLIDLNDPSATEAQYLDVSEVIGDILKELSEASYASGALLAQLSCNIVDGPHYDALEEREASDGPENNLERFICWWANFVVETP